MGRGLTIALLLVSFLSSTSCSVNIMQGFGDEDSNEAIYTSALQDVNSGSYDSALTKLADLTVPYPTMKKVILLKAAANAGKCGMNFVNLVDGLTNLSTTLFTFLMTQQNGDTAASRITRAGFCDAAENLIKTIGANAAARTPDENLFMALVNLTKVGAYLSAHADVTVRDGVLDIAPPYDSCTDPDSQEMGWAITSALTSIAASGADLGASITSINTLCAGMGGACGILEPAAFSGLQLNAIESLIREPTVGLGSCATDGNGGCGAVCL